MRIADVLRRKGSTVATVTETTTITGLLAEMATHNIGAMVVVRPDGQGGIAGMVSERDVVRKLHQRGSGLLDQPVSEIMTSLVVTCAPDDAVDDLAAMMTDNRVRHVPVLEDGRLAGIVSIGDVVKTRMEELEAEQEHLHAYITGG
ncbi:CBS domain-containing protein [Mycolicibacterium thermoresistibile]